MTGAAYVHACPACGAASGGRPAFVADVPILLNVLVADRDLARAAPRGRIALMACVSCGFVWNSAFGSVPYDDTYLVDPTRSARYLRHLDETSDHVVSLGDSRTRLDVVEIGCGQGHFAAHLARRHPERLGRVLGFDPAFRAGDVVLPANVEIRSMAFQADARVLDSYPADVVVARHLIEHIADPVAFLVAIRESFGKDRRFTLFLETPNVDRTMEAGLLHDFCFEHCSMFGPDAIRACLARAGFGAVEVDPSAFDGEYLVATAVHDPDATVLATEPVSTRTHARAFDALESLGRRFARGHVERMRARRAQGSVVLWGGAGKGALFAHLVDPEGVLLDAVVDLHEGKQGHYLPGAGHRVVSPEAALALGAGTVIVSNPTYLEEVRARCASLGLDVKVFSTADSQAVD